MRVNKSYLAPSWRPGTAPRARDLGTIPGTVPRGRDLGATSGPAPRGPWYSTRVLHHGRGASARYNTLAQYVLQYAINVHKPEVFLISLCGDDDDDDDITALGTVTNTWCKHAITNACYGLDVEKLAKHRKNAADWRIGRARLFVISVCGPPAGGPQTELIKVVRRSGCTMDRVRNHRDQ